jgi:hypothetical protein
MADSYREEVLQIIRCGKVPTKQEICVELRKRLDDDRSVWRKMRRALTSIMRDPLHEVVDRDLSLLCEEKTIRRIPYKNVHVYHVPPVRMRKLAADTAA